MSDLCTYCTIGEWSRAKPDPALLVPGDVYLPRAERLEAKLSSGHSDTQNNPASEFPGVSGQ